MSMRIMFDRPKRRHHQYCDDELGVDYRDLMDFLREREKKMKEKKEKAEYLPSMSFGEALLLSTILGPILFFGTVYGGSYVIVSIVQMWTQLLHP